MRNADGSFEFVNRDGSGDLYSQFDVVVIPRFQNTSQEFKDRFSISVMDPFKTAVGIGRLISTPLLFLLLDDTKNIPGEATFAFMDIPIFQTTDGYIIREGFRLSYTNSN